MKTKLEVSKVFFVVVMGLVVAFVVATIGGIITARRAIRAAPTCRPSAMLLFREGNATCEPGQTLVLTSTTHGVMVTCACEGKRDVIVTLCGPDAIGVTHLTSPGIVPRENLRWYLCDYGGTRVATSSSGGLP